MDKQEEIINELKEILFDIRDEKLKEEKLNHATKGTKKREISYTKEDYVSSRYNPSIS